MPEEESRPQESEAAEAEDQGSPEPEVPEGAHEAAAQATDGDDAPEGADEAAAEEGEGEQGGAESSAEPDEGQGAQSGGPMKLEEFAGAGTAAGAGGIDLLMDVDLDVKIELGRAEMAIEDVLKLRKGSVVELDKLAGDPVDILVNERPVAKGEILVVNDNFCVRITEIIDPEAGLRFEDEEND